MTRVTIVSRTRMGSGVCVGAITRDDFRNVRLLPASGVHSHPSDAPYRVGEVWEMDLGSARAIQPPHVEDVLVLSGRHVATQMGLGTWLMSKTQPWYGGAEVLFDGVLQLTPTRRAHASQSAIPPTSVGFWVPAGPLVLDEKGERYQVPWRGEQISIKYVGDGPPTPVIDAGALVRVSLSRWYSRFEGETERCWLQVSGWYPVSGATKPSTRPGPTDRPVAPPPGSSAGTVSEPSVDREWWKAGQGTRVPPRPPGRPQPRPPVIPRDPRGPRSMPPRPPGRPQPRPVTAAVSYQICMSCGSVLDADAGACWRCSDRD